MQQQPQMQQQPVQMQQQAQMQQPMPMQAGQQMAPPQPQYPPAFITLANSLELDMRTRDELYRVLSVSDIVLLCDDSGSMMTTVQPEPGQPIPQQPLTRWDELKRLAAKLIQFTTAVHPERGIDIEFLNRNGLHAVRDMNGLSPLFASPPSGGTPLVASIRRIIDRKRSVIPPSQPLLIIVATDGEPSDGTAALYNVLATRPENVYVSIAECTDNEETMNYLDGWNQRLTRFDNTDDYRADLRKVQRRMGYQFKYDYNSYVVKILLAAFVDWYKQLDQQQLLCCMIL